MPLAVSPRHLGFAAVVTALAAAFWSPLSLLARLASREEHYSHIVIIPVICLALLVRERRQIFRRVAWTPAAGLGLLAAGALCAGLGPWLIPAGSDNDRLSVTMLGLTVMVAGGFVLCYGAHALRRGVFPVVCLVLAVPLPDAVLNGAITWLQRGSAEVTAMLFDLLGVPVLRDGFSFALPRLTIEVARECSGIRSSVALLVTSLLAGHLILRSGWAKVALVVATLPVLVIKNGVRIVTLSLLSIHVDPGFLSGSLHQQGGIVFFLLALALLLPVLRVLQYSEAWSPRAPVTRN
jgi:exosortase